MLLQQLLYRLIATRRRSYCNCDAFHSLSQRTSVEEEMQEDATTRLDDRRNFRWDARTRTNRHKRPRTGNWHVNCFRRATNSTSGTPRIARGIESPSNTGWQLMRLPNLFTKNFEGCEAMRFK